MNPRLFKHRITLQSFLETENELGDVISDWQDYKTVWTMVKTIQGKEFIQAASIHAEKTYRFVIRYTPGIDSDMRIIFEGRTFEIDSVLNDDELNKTLTIIAKEVV